MVSTWETFPSTYRASEIRTILTGVRAGECVAVIGLSGSGKSNLLGFLAERCKETFPRIQMVLVDCNRLEDFTSPAIFHLIRQNLGDLMDVTDEFARLEAVITSCLGGKASLCLLFDRFDLVLEKASPTLLSNLRALRDAHKYSLTYVIATRHLIPAHNELAELFDANTLWIGPLSMDDARWNITRYASRKRMDWDDSQINKIIELSWGYPSLLRAICEAHASGTPLDMASLRNHPAVNRRVQEFWADSPTPQELENSHLTNQPLLGSVPIVITFDPTQLTAKEHLLWKYFLANPADLCEKDDLIRAVWPEDKIFTQGIRDDSLAQLVRRLREKIEPEPSSPRLIQTVPGRGYRYLPPK